MTSVRTTRILACVALVALLTGCANTEKAYVAFSYVVEPAQGLPAGMKTVSIKPAKVGPTTDAKWSDLCATIVQQLVNESRNTFGTPITVTERFDTESALEENDLAASGMSTRRGGQDVQFLAADAVILSKINVKIEKHVGKQRTLDGLFLSGHGGHGWGGGSTNIHTSEVDTVTRNMTVQTDFRLIDNTNNQVWAQSAATKHCTDRTKASPIFGSSKTEAELTPQDEIIATLVENAAREFIGKLMRCRIEVEAEVVSSANGMCAQGVRALRAEDFASALASFRAAIADNPRDHRALYAAGVAAEASGKYDVAYSYYRKACGEQNNATYMSARDRLKAYRDRAD